MALHLHPDVVVVDASNDAGRDLCRAFRLEADLHDTSIVAMTDPWIRPPLDTECHAVLPVHCLPDVLIATIDRLLLERRPVR